MRRKLTCFLLAALLTLTAVAEDLGEIIPEEEPAAEEIYEEIETQTEIEDIALDVSEPEEEIPVAENATTEEESIEIESESEEVNEEIFDDDFAEEPEEETKEVIIVESEPIVVEPEETEPIEEVNIIEVESDVIDLDDIEITVEPEVEVEPEVIEEVVEVAEEPEEEPIMMAPMMLMSAPLMTTARTPNAFGGYDYDEDGHKYEADDWHRYGFNFYTEGLTHTELYKEDATNTDVIYFHPRIRDDDTQFEMYINGTISSKAGIIASLINGKGGKVFSITYADLYDAIGDNETCTITIKCYSNATRDYEWNSKKERWDLVLGWHGGIHGNMWHNALWVQEVSGSWTFTKHTYANPATYSGSITLSKDQSVYPGDTVTITADIKLNKTVNDVTTEAEYKSVSIVWTVTSAEGGTNTYTTTDNKLEFIAENVTTYTVSAVATINY